MSQMKGEFSAQIRELRTQLVNLLSLLELELDFSEEEVEFANRKQLLQQTSTTADVVDKLAQSFSIGQALKEGIPIVIAGATNTGKSTLLNRLLHQNKAIVSDIHGTTRDIIEDRFQHKGIQYRLIDTAGLRHTDDPIENLGIDRTHEAIDQAGLVLWMISAEEGNPHLSDENGKNINLANRCVIPVINKTDLLAPDVDCIPLPEELEQLHPQPISAKTGKGIEQLLERIHEIFSRKASEHDIIITNARHLHALQQASLPLHNAIEMLKKSEQTTAAWSNGYNISCSEPSEIIAEEIRTAVRHLAEITGDITTDTLLQNIFENFCIGK